MENDVHAVSLLTVSEAAELLQMSRQTVLRLLQREKLPTFKVGNQWRISESQLIQWIEACESAQMHDTPDPDAVSEV
jgi:excisionase family DNA binding protein